MEEFVTEKRRELIEVVSEVDDKLAEAFLDDEPISPTDLEVLWIKFKRKIVKNEMCYWSILSRFMLVLVVGYFLLW